MIKTKLKEAVLNYRAVPVAAGLMTVATPFMSFAAEGAGGDAASSVSSVMTIVTSVLSLFTQFPMNIFIGGSLAVMAIKIFGQGKQVAK